MTAVVVLFSGSDMSYHSDISSVPMIAMDGAELPAPLSRVMHGMRGSFLVHACGNDLHRLSTHAVPANNGNMSRWEKPMNGPFINFCKNWVFLFLYTRLGFSPAQIFRLYYGRHPDPVANSKVELANAD